MSRRLRQKIQNSKVYSPNFLSLTNNSDLSHEKLWNEKVEQAKHVQQQKQIDRILFGIVKERIFGQFLSHDTRISNEGFYALDKMNKQLINPIPKRSRKIFPLVNQPTYELQSNSKIRSMTIDPSQNRRSLSMYQNLNEEITDYKNPIKLKSKKSIYTPKQFISQKCPNLSTYFREMAGNYTSLLYDVKLTKDMIMKQKKQKQIMTPRYLQKFLYFFNFPNSVNMKQYSNWLQVAFNCSLSQSNFFVFQVLDESRNGYLTVSDLFNALHDFPIDNSSLVEKQIYQIMDKIKQSTKSAKLITQQQKPSNQQIIIRNHTLRIDDMRDLVKESGRQLVPSSFFKSTSYHNSMYALEHSATVRQKNYQLEYSQTGQVIHKGDKKTKRQEGISFDQFSQIFNYRRSQFFSLVGKILLGEDAVALQ